MSVLNYMWQSLILYFYNIKYRLCQYIVITNSIMYRCKLIFLLISPSKKVLYPCHIKNSFTLMYIYMGIFGYEKNTTTNWVWEESPKVPKVQCYEK